MAPLRSFGRLDPCCGFNILPETQFGEPRMSDNDTNYDVLVPASATKWIALVLGLLLPIFLGVVAAQIYDSGTSKTVQVFPAPEQQ
jgi:hypothetical protein